MAWVGQGGSPLQALSLVLGTSGGQESLLPSCSALLPPKTEALGVNTPHPALLTYDGQCGDFGIYLASLQTPLVQPCLGVLGFISY